MNFFNQGIPLGRWFGITVVIHWLFVIYVGYELLNSRDPANSGLLMGLLFGTVLLHEFGHALSCKAVGGEAFHIVLWPFGGLAFVQPPKDKVWAWLVTTVCGPLVNAVLWPVAYFASKFLLVQHYGVSEWERVERDVFRAASDGGFLTLQGYGYPEMIFVYLWQINRMLLLFNLIPAYPMDGGRMLQEILWSVVGYGRSLQIAGMVGTVAGLGLVILGTGTQAIKIKQIGFQLGGQQNSMLMGIGIMCIFLSFGIYRKSQEIKGRRKN